jgi:hypothetical protein
MFGWRCSPASAAAGIRAEKPRREAAHRGRVREAQLAAALRHELTRQPRDIRHPVPEDDDDAGILRAAAGGGIGR